MARPVIHPGSARGGGSPHAAAGQSKARAKDSVGTLLRVWRYMSAHRFLLAMILLMVVLSSALGLLGPYLIGLTVDQLIEANDRSRLLFFIGLLGAVYLLQLTSLGLQNLWMIGIAQKTVSVMRFDLFRHLHRLPIAFFNRRKHGELMSRLTNDMDNVSQTLNSSFIQITSSVLTFVGMISMMLWLSPLLTLITLTIVPLMVLGMKWITKRTGRYFKEQQRHLGELNGLIEETLSGQRIVKTFSREKQVTAAFLARNEKLKQSGYWAQTYSGFIPKLMNVLNNMSFAVIAGAGGILALNGFIKIGVIITFSEYARQFTRPLNDLANQFNTFLSAIAGAERVFEVIDEDGEARDEGGAKELSEIRGEIEFSNVTFAYDEEQVTLKDISFHAEPGETIALVGPTGAGKTTIVQLLSRFYDPAQGGILIDGRDTRLITRKSLRQHMGFVLQDSFLFAGTIRDNIRYGKLDASDAEVEHAAKLANAHSFIVNMPRGYDTEIEPDGTSISQGQKQLLAIARAILVDPSIFILDEATSSIDTVTEIKIQEALYRLMNGRTSIVIAHRLNTIQRADRILVIDDGTIVESGSHQQLIEQKGYYYSMVRNQFDSAAKLVN